MGFEHLATDTLAYQMFKDDLACSDTNCWVKMDGNFGLSITDEVSCLVVDHSLYRSSETCWRRVVHLFRIRSTNTDLQEWTVTYFEIDGLYNFQYVIC